MKSAKFVTASLALLLVLLTISISFGGTYRHKWTVFPDRSCIKIAASVPQIAEVAKCIGGDSVCVVSLLKSDEDTQHPKLYNSMTKAVKEADVLLRLSPSIDPYIEDLLKNNSSVSCYSCISIATSLQQTQEAIAQAVLSVLITEEPRSESKFRARYQAYMNSLKSSDSHK